MSGALDGKVALVTGGGRGIGRGIALRLARDGADVALVDIGTDGISSVAEEVTEIGSKATTFVADVSDRDQVFAAVDHAATTLGGFDIMVNNAGIALVGPISDVTPEESRCFCTRDVCWLTQLVTERKRGGESSEAVV